MKNKNEFIKNYTDIAKKLNKSEFEKIIFDIEVKISNSDLVKSDFGPHTQLLQSGFVSFCMNMKNFRSFYHFVFKYHPNTKMEIYYDYMSLSHLWDEVLIVPSQSDLIEFQARMKSLIGIKAVVFKHATSFEISDEYMDIEGALNPDLSNIFNYVRQRHGHARNH